VGKGGLGHSHVGACGIAAEPVHEVFHLPLSFSPSLSCCVGPLPLASSRSTLLCMQNGDDRV
jgi:hypothetical protein